MLPKPYNEMFDKEWKHLKDILKQSEFSRLAQYDKVADISGWAKVAVIVPQSLKMQELIDELMDENAAKA